MSNKRIIFHIDMDSYFASVEQQANPQLRGKPIVVSGKEGSRSVIVAASREAKVFGVKTAMLQHEAKRLCPNLTFVEGDGAKYSATTKKFLEIFKGVTDKMEVFSIDEAFLDVSGHAKSFADAEKLALQIKEDLRREVGECVTCSVGIAENKLLAKLASDMRKPNGIFFITNKNLNQVFREIKLTDFCGIGPRIFKRLDSLGYDTVVRLQRAHLQVLVSEFGPHYGQKLYNMVRGIDHEPVVSYLEAPEVKSVGRSHTLPYNTFEKEKILSVMLHLCEKIGRELRRKKLAGKTVVVYWRYPDFTHGGKRITFSRHVNDSLKLFEFGKQVLQNFRLPKAIRLVGVHVSNLTEAYTQRSLWEAERKMQDLLPALDKINDTYGELTVKPAYLLKMKRLRNKVGGFKLMD